MKHPSNKNLSALLVAALTGLAALSASAQTNFFNDAENTSSTDTYPGDPGNGWVTGWETQFGVNGGNSGFWGVEPHVINTNPVQVGTNTSGGNYFNFGIANSESQVRRKYVSNGDLNTALAHIIEFDLRMDSFTGVAFTSASDGISICTRRTTGTDVGGNATFWIRAQAANDGSAPLAAAGRWNFYNGGISSSSDASGFFSNSTAVPFVIGRAYHFKIQLDPPSKTYIGSVTDGTNTFTTTPLRYKSFSDNNFNNISNSTYLAFVPRTSSRVAVPPGPTETNLISVDNIRIYVDPNVIPPIISTLTPASSTIFYPASSNLVFSALTLGPNNIIPSSNMVLILNGANVSGSLAISGTDASTNRIATYASLIPNTSYVGTFSIKDQNGRSTTNSFFFDTFVETNVTILEAENYNFETGSASCPGVNRTNFNANGYLQDPLPSDLDQLSAGYTNEVEGYVDRAGVSGIDYFDASASVFQSQYRFCDTFDTRTKPGAEYLRPAYAAIALNDFVLEHIDAGDWANYTHIYPNTNYQVYLRVGARNRAVKYQLSKVTSDRTQPNQTTVNLGTFTVPPLAARETLMYRALSDAFGNPVLLHLNGEQTLRLTSLDANNNDDTYVNFILLNPQAGTTTPPFVAQYYPTANESNIPPQTAVSLTLANGSSAVATNTILLIVNGSNVTSLASIAATSGGATINYLPPTFFARPSLNTAVVVYGDGTGPLQTNQWSFHVGTYLPGLPIKVNFCQPASTNYPGYLKDTSLLYADRGNGFSYGWDRDFPEDTRQSFGPAVATPPDDAPAPDQRYATFTHLNKASPPRIFELTLPNGNYGVFGVAGDATAIDSVYRVSVEGVIVLDGTPFFPEQWVSGSNVVTITDGRLTLTSAGGSNGKINFIDVWPLDYAAPDFTLHNPTVSGSTFSFTINTISRAPYVIEYKNSLADPTWSTLTTMAGNGGPMVVNDTISGARIYRMRIP